jgi:hypothetical protein
MTITTSEELILSAATRSFGNKPGWKSKLAVNLVIGALIVTIIWGAFLVAFMAYLIGLWH